MVIIDDHPLVLSALRDLITGGSLSADVRAFPSVSAALPILLTGKPVLVVLDLGLPDISGPFAVETVCRAAGEATVAVLTGDTALARSIPAVCSGRVPFLDKGMRTDDLTREIQGLLRRCGLDDAWPVDERPEHQIQGLASLSQKQRETLRLLSTGRTNEEIAKVMNLSRETVKTHLSEIFSKMQVRNRIQAVLLFQSLGRETQEE